MKPKFLFVLILGFLGCEVSPRTGDIAGKVTDSITGKPVPDVQVYTDPATQVVSTDQDGEFSIAEVPEGNYEVRYGKEGYQEGSKRVAVRAGQVVRADFSLKPLKGIIYGKVVDAETGGPISGASVTTAPPTASVTTDAEGNYRIGPVGIGSYTVKVSREGYEDMELQATLEPGEEKRLDFHMRRYVPPQVEVTSPGEGVVLSTSDVTVSWTGNEVVESFMYRLLPDPRYREWRETTERGATFELLDESEDELYTFEIKALDGSGRESEVERRRFGVDAIHGPALWTKPRAVWVEDFSLDPDFELWVMAEDVVDLLGGHIVLEFDRDKLKLREGIRPGEFILAKTDEARLVFLHTDLLKANLEGRLEVDIVALRKDGSPEVSGSGPILKLKFRAISPGNTYIELGPGSKLRDAMNRDIGLVRYRSEVSVR